MKHLLYETDWLASQPVFYNEETGSASRNINEVIDRRDVEFHPEGLQNYLDFGYSVLEQTPIRHVKFLRHSSRLWKDDNGGLSVEYLDDPVGEWLEYSLSEKEVIDLIRERVQAWERSIDGEIIIPTSGGYDSRLLNWCVNERTRIRSFTYGFTERQSDCYEVAYAQRLSEILGTHWERIPLGDYHQYFDHWHRLFGISTHAHGMYHVEFYGRVLPIVGSGRGLLSGLNCDSFSGSRLQVILEERQMSVPTAEELPVLGLTWGMHADSARCRFATDLGLRRRFLEEHADDLNDYRWKLVWKVRLKNMLMTYLLRVPDYFGFRAWTPFHDIDVAMAMLNLPRDRTRNRLWLKEFYEVQGLDLEAMGISGKHGRELKHIAMDRVPLEPLDDVLLSEVVEPDYVRWINRSVQPRGTLRRSLPRLYPELRRIRGGYRAYRLIHRSVQRQLSERLDAYHAYLTLKPVETLLRRRESGDGDMK